MFRIGEFSKIAQVSGRLLRYYDEIGLLSPESIDPETGYRYYSARQLPQLNRILVLKELGLSLGQIAQLLKRDTSTDELRGMLALRKAQIEQSVQEEMARLRVVEARLEQIDEHGQVQEPDVVLKSVPEQQFLSLREVLPDMAAIRRLVQ
jgi:DNA-binding transcriptional MerR regulator